MKYQHLLYATGEGVATITLNRPEKLNSFNKALVEELLDALEQAEHDERVRSLVLTGSGNGFSAGQDLAELVGSKREEVEQIVRTRCNRMVKALRSHRLPIICAVNGVAAGAGANVALCCDLVLASTEATFIQSFVHVGLLPDSGGTWFLPRLVGAARARSLALLGERISAEEAERFGMIYRTVPPDALHEETNRLASRMAALPTRSLSMIKRALDRSFENTLDQQLELEADLQTALGRTSDYREGVAAFLEKRKPRFEGR